MHLSLLHVQGPDSEACHKVEGPTPLMSLRSVFYKATSSDLPKQILVLWYSYSSQTRRRKSNLVIDANTVGQMLWDHPLSPRCIFQISPCSPLHIFIVTRDRRQESYSIFFFVFNLLSTASCIHELDFTNCHTSDRNHTKISLRLMRHLNAAFLSKSWKVSAGFPALGFTPIICAKKSATEVSWSKPRGQSFQPLSPRVSARKGQSDNRVSPCSSSFHHSFTGGPKHLCVSFELKKKNQTEGQPWGGICRRLSSLGKFCHLYEIYLILWIKVILV